MLGLVAFVALIVTIFWVSFRGTVMGSRSRVFGGRDLEPVAGAVAFVVTERSAVAATLQVVNAAGGEARELAGDVEIQSVPSWSPDHARVAYATSSGRVLRTLAAGGGEPTELTAPTEDFTADRKPVWSPDGTQLAFLSIHRDAVPITSVHVLPAAGGSPRRMGPDLQEYQQCFTALDDAEECQAWPTGDAEEVAWLPGGELVYRATANQDDAGAADSGSAVHGLYRVGLDGSPPRLVREIERAADQLVPSPDGRFLLYGQMHGSTHVIELASGQSWQIGEELHDPSWSADSRRLLFVDDGAVVTSAADGGDRVNLTHTPSGDGSSTDVHPTAAVWSPDGSHIAFTAVVGSAGEDLFVANADGTGWTEIFSGDGDIGGLHWLPTEVAD